MHKPGTPWPVATRVSFIVAFEGLRREHPRLSARRFCEATEVPYPTFARWWAGQRAIRGSEASSTAPNARGAALPLWRAASWTSSAGFTASSAWASAVFTHTSPRSASSPAASAASTGVLKRAGALVLRPRKPRPLWTRYAKALPGERGQMDLKYLPQGRYQLTLVDDCSRLLAATVLTQRTTAAVCRALPHLLHCFPFRCIQTDNGSEFGRTLTLLLRRLGIRHTRIRPRCPHLNGKVDRAQRTVQEEYWDGVGPGPVEDWERGLQDYLRFYNRRRLHSALGYTAPMAYALQRLPRARISHVS